MSQIPDTDAYYDGGNYAEPEHEEGEATEADDRRIDDARDEGGGDDDEHGGGNQPSVKFPGR